MDGIRVGIDAQESLGSVRGRGVYLLRLVPEMARLRPDMRFRLFTATFRRVPPPETLRNGTKEWIRHPIPNALPKTIFSFVRDRVFMPVSARLGGVTLFHGMSILPFLPRSVRTVTTLFDFSAFLFPPEPHSGLDPIRLQNELLETLHRAERIIAISEYVRGECLSRLGLAPEQVIAVPLAAGGSFRRMGTSSFPDAPGPWSFPFFLWTGTVERRKNLDVLFRAFRAYVSEAGGKAHLVLAGPGPHAQALDAMARSPDLRGLEARVHYVGRLEVEDLVRAYNLALAFVFPSRYEGFGLPLLEAMACGAPCVAARAASLPEVGGDACLWFDPDDDAALAEHLVRLVGDPSLREDLSRRGLARSRLFSWERTARETLRVYGEVLEGRWA